MLLLLLIAIALARIAHTYTVFSQTLDEDAHIAAGMEWLDRGTYNYEGMHPPLARIAVAIGPFMAGVRSMGQPGMRKEGNEILHAMGAYERNLTLARVGILPFFVLATVVVWCWSRQIAGLTGAVFATALFTTLPPVLAHAGVATTDMPATAMLVLTLWLFSNWLFEPTLPRSFGVGLATGLAILSKFSALLFLPACIMGIILWKVIQGRRVHSTSVIGVRVILISVFIMSVTTFIVIWAGYRFSVGSLMEQATSFDTVRDVESIGSVQQRMFSGVERVFGNESKLSSVAQAIMRAPIPAPEFFLGIAWVGAKNQDGHLSYLLGEKRIDGWWYYFPVVLGVKTPLAFLFLSVAGIVIAFHKALRRNLWIEAIPAIGAITLLVICMPSRINIGVRHILAIYPLLAIVAGYGVSTLWQAGLPRPFIPMVISGLLLWQIVSSARAHPDYLAYFNLLAGEHPERVLVVGDLDWGQDLKRLCNSLRKRGVVEVAIAYRGYADLKRHPLPRFRELVPYEHTKGWIAISIYYQVMEEGFAWLKTYDQVERVGKSIYLYYIPE